MPFIRVIANKKLDATGVAMIKKSGFMLDYEDPQKIWVELSSGLTQKDVAVVEVKVEQDDFEKKPFQSFCEIVGTIVRDCLGKSVEVITEVKGFKPMAWCPTDKGKQVYGE